MTRLNELANFMEDVKALITSANELGINSDIIPHMAALDPEFAQDVNNLLAIFTSVEIPSIPAAEPTPEVEVPMAVEIEPVVEAEPGPETNEVPVEEHVEEAPEFVGATWKKHPDLEGVELHPDGSIRINGNPVTPRMVGGYTKFYDPNTRKYYALAAAMLTTFSGRTDNSMAPYYLDGNKENCALSNLRWATKDSSLTTSQIERACKIIAENPRLSESELLNMLVREHTIKSITALKSILAGNWRSISDRYFTVRGGSIIPIMTEPTSESNDEANEADDAGNLRGILALSKDTTFVRDLYREKIESGEASSDDRTALILSYVMDGKDNVGDIQKAIRKDFGRKVMIPNKEIQSVIG